MGSVENVQLVENFYAAFSEHDAQAMAACYTSDVTFSDPGFGELHGPEVGAMWAMLCRGGADLVVEASDIRADSKTGSANWVAEYTFGPLHNKVTNHISANFRFEGGLIAEHRDTFSFYDWSKQAFGPFGLALGWIPLTPLAMQAVARRQLHSYMDRKGIER